MLKRKECDGLRNEDATTTDGSTTVFSRLYEWGEERVAESNTSCTGAFVAGKREREAQKKAEGREKCRERVDAAMDTLSGRGVR